MEHQDSLGVALGESLIEGFNAEAARVRVPVGHGWSDADWDGSKEARNSPAGRRLRAVRRAVEEDPPVDVAMVTGRARRAAPGQRALGVDNFDLTTAVIGAAIDQRYLDIDQASPPRLVPGPAYLSPPNVRGVDFHHPEVSLVVGARMLLSDPLAELAPLPPGLTSIVLPVRLLEALALGDALPLPDVHCKVQEEVRQQAPHLLERGGCGRIVRAVEVAASLLAELGWVAVEVEGDGSPVLHGTRLGSIGCLMTITVLTRCLPPGLEEDHLASGHLRSRDGYVDLRDVPVPIVAN